MAAATSTRPSFGSRQRQKFIHRHFRSENAYHIALSVEDRIQPSLRKGIEIHLLIRIKESGCMWRGICFRPQKGVAQQRTSFTSVDGDKNLAAMNFPHDASHRPQIHRGEIVSHGMEPAAHRTT